MAKITFNLTLDQATLLIAAMKDHLGENEEWADKEYVIKGTAKFWKQLVRAHVRKEATKGILEQINNEENSNGILPGLTGNVE